MDTRQTCHLKYFKIIELKHDFSMGFKNRKILHRKKSDTAFTKTTIKNLTFIVNSYGFL